MAAQVLLYRMPAGIPGFVTRNSESSVEPQLLNPTLPFPSFGVPGKIVNNLFVPIAAGDTTANVYGFLTKAYPANNSNDPLGTSVPPISGVAGAMRRGYIAVQVNAGTASKGSQVYVRVAAAAAGKPIGGIEAVADSTNTFALVGATFMGAADANGFSEIAYNI